MDAAPFGKIRSKTVVDEVWGQLRRLILQGTLEPGARLIEMEIASRMQTSQSSIREALQRLERDGLVERRPRTGTFVTPLVTGDVNEVLTIRAVVESFAARRAIEFIEPEQLRELEALVERMHLAAREDDTVLFYEHDITFHRNICRWARHPALLRAWIPLSNELLRFLILSPPPSDLSGVADSHWRIIDALRSRDADLAARSIREHVMVRVRQQTVRDLEEAMGFTSGDVGGSTSPSEAVPRSSRG